MKILAQTSRVLDQAFEIGAFGATEANGELVVLPGTDWPLKAEFFREVPDLLVSGRDGESFVICDYFHGDTATDLVIEGGFLLWLNLIERLATERPAPGQYAQAATVDGESEPQAPSEEELAAREATNAALEAGETPEFVLEAAAREAFGESDVANSFGGLGVFGVENGGNSKETSKEYKRAVQVAFEAANARGASLDEVAEIEAEVRENF